jgi:UDP-N-acetylmuramoyl-tripeptide--D-alanyl-D-alanine ligase
MNPTPFLTITISFALWYYFATLLQWHSYKISRVIFNFHKRWWHILFFALPLSFFTVGSLLGYNKLTSYITLAYLIVAFYFWLRGVDKKLVFTARVKRFATIFTLCLGVAFYFTFQSSAPLFALILSFIISIRFEKELAIRYEQKARNIVLQNKNLVVVAITASYGKTSIKNFLAHILASKYNAYATPRSVNTKMGIAKDINESLPSDAEIYIVEAGARARGDIADITELVEPHFVVIGKVGPAHIEYFKTIENIRSTKCELLASTRIKKAFCYENSGASHENAVIFGENSECKISNVARSLEGISFELMIGDESVTFGAPLLGAFNAINLSAAILVAIELGMDKESIQTALRTLKQVEHRLQRIDAGGKIIIDDSFNGNIDGVLEGIEICRLHTGEKVIVTPGLVEASDEDNAKFAKAIDELFDTVIMTGSLNVKLFDEIITRPRKILLADKSGLVSLLANQTKAGDLIYFANDAPSYI